MRLAVHPEWTPAKTHHFGSGNSDCDQGIGALQMLAVDIAAGLNRSAEQSGIQGEVGRASPYARLRLEGQRSGGSENALPVHPENEVGGPVSSGIPETHEG